jgi:diguanylate cyclase (GGDEF)-like protein
MGNTTMTPKLVHQELSQQAIAGALIAIVLMPIWSIFDYFVDPINFKKFLILRLGATLVNLAGLIVYIKTGKQVAHFRKSAMLTYLTLVVSMLPLCIITEEKLPYYVAYSTVFFAVSILAIWPLRYFVLPMIMAVSVLVIVHWNTVNDLKTTTTGIFLMINVCSMSSVASWLTYRNFLDNESLMIQLQNLSNTDRLTGLHNRRYFDIRLQDLLAQAQRNDSLTAVMMLDVDHFKKYNDHYGHQQGDECLCQFSDCLRKVLSRETDFVARYGGEEFVVVMPNTDVVGAAVIASKIIARLGEIKIPHCQSPVASFVTASIGIACRKSMSSLEIVALADSALYQAKQSGRNRFVTA